MARSSGSSLVSRNGPGSAATSIAESIIKPADATGGKTKCIECGDYECCCIPCTIL
ncbi:Fc.00g113880.m01.CDS01 [Cosmosporella sp. VM-42]